jgi:hypothetical protein
MMIAEVDKNIVRILRRIFTGRTRLEGQETVRERKGRHWTGCISCPANGY